MMADFITKWFGTKRNLYEIFEINKNADNTQINKAYKKLALKYHPDKNLKDIHATEKFQALSIIHLILSDKEKRELYDETGIIDENTSLSSTTMANWEEYWRLLFPKIKEKDIKSYENEYIRSEEEKKDLLKLYQTYKGNMIQIIDHMMFGSVNQISRYQEIIQSAIDKKEVPIYKKFKDIDKKIIDKKIKKEKKEENEAEILIQKIKRKNITPTEIDTNPISLKRKQENKDTFSDLLKNIENKYTKKKRIKSNSNKKSSTEPSEEEFLAIQKKLKKTK